MTGLVTVVDFDDRPTDTTTAVDRDGDAPVPGLVEATEAAGPGVAPPPPPGAHASVDGSGHLSLSALHQAVLRDGRRITLLDDPGWSLDGPPRVRRYVSIEQVKADARTVVGPDEETTETGDQVRAHWARLAEVLHRHGVQIDATALARLPHEVELSGRLHAYYSKP